MTKQKSCRALISNSVDDHPRFVAYHPKSFGMIIPTFGNNHEGYVFCRLLGIGEGASGGSGWPPKPLWTLPGSTLDCPGSPWNTPEAARSDFDSIWIGLESVWGRFLFDFHSIVVRLAVRSFVRACHSRLPRRRGKQKNAELFAAACLDAVCLAQANFAIPSEV